MPYLQNNYNNWIWNETFENPVTTAENWSVVEFQESRIDLNYNTSGLPISIPEWDNRCCLIKYGPLSGVLTHVFSQSYGKTFYGVDILLSGWIGPDDLNEVVKAGQDSFSGGQLIFNLGLTLVGPDVDLELVVRPSSSPPQTFDYAITSGVKYNFEFHWDTDSANYWEARVNGAVWQSGNITGAALGRKLKRIELGENGPGEAAAVWLDNFRIDKTYYPSEVPDAFASTTLIGMPWWWWEQR